MTVGDGNDYNLANGDVSGRKLTTAAKSPTISTGGDITHVVFANDAALTASDDFYVTTSPSRTVIVSDVVNLAPVTVENRQVV